MRCRCLIEEFKTVGGRSTGRRALSRVNLASRSAVTLHALIPIEGVNLDFTASCCRKHAIGFATIASLVYPMCFSTRTKTVPSVTAVRLKRMCCLASQHTCLKRLLALACQSHHHPAAWKMSSAIYLTTVGTSCSAITLCYECQRRACLNILPGGSGNQYAIRRLVLQTHNGH